ncbi:MAG TPA: hypothetical protein VER03_05090 [Bryobacteraceae bacterium]|nr:hypothetical protein [Bryobacteraceae bacterium]
MDKDSIKAKLRELEPALRPPELSICISTVALRAGKPRQNPRSM